MTVNPQTTRERMFFYNWVYEFFPENLGRLREHNNKILDLSILALKHTVPAAEEQFDERIQFITQLFEDKPFVFESFLAWTKSFINRNDNPQNRYLYDDQKKSIIIELMTRMQNNFFSELFHKSEEERIAGNTITKPKAALYYPEYTNGLIVGTVRFMNLLDGASREQIDYYLFFFHKNLPFICMEYEKKFMSYIAFDRFNKLADLKILEMKILNDRQEQKNEVDE